MKSTYIQNNKHDFDQIDSIALNIKHVILILVPIKPINTNVWLFTIALSIVLRQFDFIFLE